MTEHRTAWQRLRPVAGAAILLGCVVLFSAPLIRHGRQLLDYPWEFRWGWLAASMALMAGAFLLLPLAAARLLRGYGYRVPYVDVARIYFTAQMAKYIPGGGVWEAVGRSVLYRRAGISLIHGATAMLYETGLIILASGTVGSLAIARTLPPALAAAAIAATAGLTVTMLAWPQLPFRLLRATGVKRFRDIPMVTHGAVLQAFLLFLCFWVVAGLAFCLLLKGSVSNCPATPLTCVTTLAAGWTVGFLAIVTPGGLGIREGVLAFLLQPLFPVAVVAALVVLARVQWMTCEAFAFALFSLKGKFSHD